MLGRDVPDKVLINVVTFCSDRLSNMLPGAIKASDWLKFLMIFLSDTT
jgi:hypothetical protein